jgi:tRNA pseudouridine55 synthase
VRYKRLWAREARVTSEAISGILNVHKDAGPTSFDVVALVRRGTGVRKVGHAGTLDPAATGVLLVCLGQAVRVSEYLMDLPKTYRASIALGTATDTYDAEGSPTFNADSVEVSRESVMAVLEQFVGEIQQTPPSYSAVKVDGQRAYRLARKGQPVALKPRPVVVHRIDLLRFAQTGARPGEPPVVEIDVECSKGTYIRSLAHDLGRELGCGAHLAELVRTRVGPFGVDSATGTEALQAAFEDGSWRELVLPMDCGLAHLPAVTLGVADEQDIRHGQAVRLENAAPKPEDGREWRAYGEDGGLVAIIRYDATEGAWRPRKVFG